MPYEIIEHTADLRIKVSGKILEELFKESLRAMMEIMDGILAAKEKSKRKITVSASDKTALLIDFLNEVLSSAYINKEIYDKIIFSEFSEKKIAAEISGQKVERFNKDIKAATYHEAEIKQNEKGRWETLLVFDI